MAISKSVVGYEGRYEVTNTGDVWSLPNSRRHHIQLLKQVPHVRSGHMMVGLTSRDESGRWVQRTHYVHTLVLEAFVGPRPDGMEACHNDGNPKNNHKDNLRWDTYQANQQDRERHGTSNRGNRNPMAKLDEEKVARIKARLRAGEGRQALASEFGVTLSCIKNIDNGYRWKEVVCAPMP